MVGSFAKKPSDAQIRFNRMRYMVRAATLKAISGADPVPAGRPIVPDLFGTGPDPGPQAATR